jgi:hypothetical protein
MRLFRDGVEVPATDYNLKLGRSTSWAPVIDFKAPLGSGSYTVTWDSKGFSTFTPDVRPSPGASTRPASCSTPCPQCWHDHLDYVEDEPCVSCGCRSSIQLIDGHPAVAGPRIFCEDSGPWFDMLATMGSDEQGRFQRWLREVEARDSPDSAARQLLEQLVAMGRVGYDIFLVHLHTSDGWIAIALDL